MPDLPSGDLAQDRPSAVLASAAVIISDWPESYGTPLADLLAHESAHAADLERESDQTGWDRYPPGALLLQLARGILAEQDPA